MLPISFRDCGLQKKFELRVPSGFPVGHSKESSVGWRRGKRSCGETSWALGHVSCIPDHHSECDHYSFQGNDQSPLQKSSFNANIFTWNCVCCLFTIQTIQSREGGKGKSFFLQRVGPFRLMISCKVSCGPAESGSELWVYNQMTSSP